MLLSEKNKEEEGEEEEDEQGDENNRRTRTTTTNDDQKNRGNGSKEVDKRESGEGDHQKEEEEEVEGNEQPTHHSSVMNCAKDDDENQVMSGPKLAAASLALMCGAILFRNLHDQGGLLNPSSVPAGAAIATVIIYALLTKITFFSFLIAECYPIVHHHHCTYLTAFGIALRERIEPLWLPPFLCSMFNTLVLDTFTTAAPPGLYVFVFIEFWMYFILTNFMVLPLIIIRLLRHWNDANQIIPDPTIFIINAPIASSSVALSFLLQYGIQQIEGHQGEVTCQEHHYCRMFSLGSPEAAASFYAVLMLLMVVVVAPFSFLVLARRWEYIRPRQPNWIFDDPVPRETYGAMTFPSSSPVAALALAANLFTIGFNLGQGQVGWGWVWWLYTAVLLLFYVWGVAVTLACNVYTLIHARVLVLGDEGTRKRDVLGEEERESRR